MALPVANLGYMPNMGSPGRGPTTVINDPWQELAAQALASVVQQGINNSFQKDHTVTAQNEGLAIDPEAKAAAWYKKPFTGATTDKSQLQQLRGEKQQSKRALLAENSASQRHYESMANSKELSAAQIAATKEEGAAGRTHQRDIQGLSQLFQSTENEAGRTAARAESEAGRTAAMERLDKEIVAQEASIGRKLSAEERMTVTRAFLDNVGRMSIQDKSGANMRVNLLNEANAKTGGPQLPAPTTNSQDIDAYAKELERLGFRVLPPGSY